MAAIANQLTNIAQRVRQCNKVTLVRAYARSARQFCSETRWYRVNLNGTLAANTRVYSLGTDPNLEIITATAVQVTALNGQRYWPLVTMSPAAINPNVASGEPRRFAYLPEASIAYDPLPNGAYPTLIELACQPRDESTDIPDELLIKWRQAFEAGALEYLFSLTGEAWADANESKVQGLKYRAFINNAKADVQRGFQVGAVRALPRRFVTRG